MLTLRNLTGILSSLGSIVSFSSLRYTTAKMRRTLFLVLSALLCSAVLGAVAPLDEHSSKINSALPSVVRPTGECTDSDYDCLCIKAVEENNKIRMRHGKDSSPSVGPQRMLTNAMDHSMTLPSSFVHQDLTMATEKVQCGVFISGENIAMHQDSSITDHVAECMKQWEVCFFDFFFEILMSSGSPCHLPRT
jgi:hypothetical protein